MGGMFFHDQLAKHLARAGFEVRHVEREDNHAEVWVLKVRRGRVPAGREIDCTQRTVLAFLKHRLVAIPSRKPNPIREVWNFPNVPFPKGHQFRHYKRVLFGGHFQQSGDGVGADSWRASSASSRAFTPSSMPVLKCSWYSLSQTLSGFC